MKMPQSNFSQSGLASIFGIDLEVDAKAPTTKSRKRTAILAGTVCGIVGLAVFVVLGGYMALRWRKMHSHLEDPVYEKDVHPDAHPDVDEGVLEKVEAPSNSIRTQSRHDGFL